MNDQVPVLVSEGWKKSPFTILVGKGFHSSANDPSDLASIPSLECRLRLSPTFDCRMRKTPFFVDRERILILPG
jgi:hypothetical protein